MILPVSSITITASSEACSRAARITSLTCASDWARSMASPSASATISIAALSSSLQMRSPTQSLTATDPHELPFAKIGMDRKDLIFWFSKSWRRKPSMSRVRPANILP